MANKKNINRVVNSSYIVHGWMVVDLKLKSPKKDLFALIYSFTQDGESKFYGSNEYCQLMTGFSRRSIQTHLTELCEMNLIKEIPTPGNVRNEYIANLDEIERVRELHRREREPRSEGMQGMHSNGARNAPPIISNKKLSVYKKVYNQLVFPFDDLEFLAKFEQYVENRSRELKKPLKTKRAIQRLLGLIGKLSNNSPKLAIEIIEQSMNMDWLDFYPLKKQKAESDNQKQGAKSYVEKLIFENE